MLLINQLQIIWEYECHSNSSMKYVNCSIFAPKCSASHDYITIRLPLISYNLRVHSFILDKISIVKTLSNNAIFWTMRCVSIACLPKNCVTISRELCSLVSTKIGRQAHYRNKIRNLNYNVNCMKQVAMHIASYK